jgi:hypothetical protein
MGSIFASLTPFFARLAGWVAKSVFWSGLLGAVGPIVSAIATLIGGFISAVSEIVVSLSKSPEGRVVLGICAAGLGFLYLRFHYIEEGKAMVQAKTVMVERQCAPVRKDNRKVR